MGFVYNSGGTNARLRREDCEFVKHDKLFSKWKVLVGPSEKREGQGAAAGGTVNGRYHVQNVPAMEFGPGVFELGVTAPSWAQNAQQQSYLKREDVIPVYVGQAANIRHRLHKFGQAAAHLDQTTSTRSANLYQECGISPPTSPVQSGGDGAAGSGPRLFSEVFALGSSIAFRWAHTDSRVVAEQVEAELQTVFDYAWNKTPNGTRRSRDILVKLFMAWPTTKDHSSTSNSWRITTTTSRRSWRLMCTRDTVGIKVALRKPKTPKSTQSYSTSILTNRRNLCCFPLTVQPQQIPRTPDRPRKRARAPVVLKQQQQDQSRKKRTVSYWRCRFGFQFCTGRIMSSRQACVRVQEEPVPPQAPKRPGSLSFNTWMNLPEPADAHRVHNHGDCRIPDFGVSLQPETAMRHSGKMRLYGLMPGEESCKRG